MDSMPGPSEFEIIKLLWKNKQLSSREIHDHTTGKTGWAYSTTRTIVERMVKKGYLHKENFHGLYVYSPALSKVTLYAKQLTKLAESVFEIDALSFLPLFAGSDVLSEEEVASLRDVLRRKEKES